MKNNQKGFSIVAVIVIIVVLGLLGTIGWLVYDRQKNKTPKTQVSPVSRNDTTEISEVSGFNVSSFTLDTAKLPAGWKITYNTDALISIESDDCSVEALRENDPNLVSTKAAEGIEKLFVANDDTSTKGYTVTKKADSTIVINTSDGLKKVSTREYLWDLPEGGNPFRFSRTYSVNDGYYISLKRTCKSEAGFASTNAAIQAITFKTQAN